MTWEWLADLLEGHGYELHLAHPRSGPRRSPRRGSRQTPNDARTLAHLLRADLLREAYVTLRDQRDLLRQRVVLTQMRSARKNRVHALIAWQGI